MLLWTNLLPLGVAGQWVWRLRDEPLTTRPAQGSLAAFAAALLATFIVLDRLRSSRLPARRLCGLLLAVIILLGTVTALGLALDGSGYWLTAASVVVSDVSMGYYQQAMQLHNVRSLLAAHHQRATDPGVPDRVRTHPPGPILFCHALRSFLLAHPSWPMAFEGAVCARLGLPATAIHRATRNFSAAPLSRLDAIIALLVALVLSIIWVLIALPAFGIGAAIFDRRVGLILALLAISIPSLLHFTPSIDSFGAVLAATFLYLWLLALKMSRWWVYLLAGAAAVLMLMWSFGFLILGVVAAAAALPVWCQGSVQQRRVHWRGLVLCVSTFAVAYALVYLWSGYNILTALPASLAAHRQVLATWGRSYWVWVPMNLYDFLLFMGPALVVVTTAATYWGLKVRQWPPMAIGFVWGLLIALGLLLISGSTRGEVGRIWVFLMPLVALPAAQQVSELREGQLLWTGAGLVALPVGFALVLSSKLAPVMPY